VLEHFQTDTADYADILLPATTQLEHVDIHASYGHLYWMMNNPAIAPAGRSEAELGDLPAARGAMGFDDPCFRDSDEELAALGDRRRRIRATRRIDCRQAEGRGLAAAVGAETLRAVRRGKFPTPSGKVRVLQLRELFC
jgi:anaerobic selenocysteine-containing dehydrogenase